MALIAITTAITIREGVCSISSRAWTLEPDYMGSNVSSVTSKLWSSHSILCAINPLDERFEIRITRQSTDSLSIV